MIHGKSIAIFASGDIRITGGVNAATLELAKVLAEKNRVHIISTDNKLDRPVPVLPGINLHFTRAPRNLLWAHAITPFLALRDGLMFEDLDADVFHFNNCCDMGIVSRRVKRPSVVVLHGVLSLPADEAKKSSYALKNLYFIKNLYLLPFFRRSLKEADVIVVVNSMLRNHVKFLCPGGVEKTVIVPNGVDVSRFGNAPKGKVRKKYGLEDKLIILYPGRLVPFRDHEDIIYALPEIVKSCPEAVLLLAGGGRREGELKEMVRRLKMERYVIFAGDIPYNEMPEYYADADIIFNAGLPPESILEPADNSMRKCMDDVSFMSGSIATLEGMAAGKPLVCLKPGVTIKKEPVDPDDVGVLLPVHQTELLAEAIVSLIRDEKIREEIGSRAKEYIINNRTWKICSERMLQAYETAIMKHR